MSDQIPDDVERPDWSGLDGHLGVRDTRDFGELVERIAAVGRAAHNPFGDEIVRVVGRLRELAREAGRRLAEDRLPSGTGSDAQRQRLAEEHERRQRVTDAAQAANAGEPPAGDQ